MAEDVIIAQPQLDLSQWNRSISAMLADVARIEAMVKSIGGGGTGIDIKFKATGDTQIQSMLDKFESGVTADVDFKTPNDNVVKGILDDAKAGVTSEIDFNTVDENLVRGVLIDAKAGTDSTIEFKAEGERKIAGLLEDAKAGTTSDIKLNLSGDDEVRRTLNDIKGQLEGLHSLAVIDLALNTANFVQNLESLPLVSTILDIDNAVHQVTGTVNRELPGVGETINNLYTNNWGDSREEVAGVITQLAQLRDENGDFIVSLGDLEGAAQGAFEAAAIGGEDVNSVIMAGAALVRNGLVPDFETAFDVISQGYADGLNSSGDFLDSITEYSQTLKGSGITIEGFYNILSQGLGAGAYNTDKLVDSFKEMTNLTKEEVAVNVTTGDATDRINALKELGVFDIAVQYTEGDITGDEYIQSVIDALVTKADDPANQRRLALAIFGPTMVEEAGLDNLLVDIGRNVDYADAGEEFSGELFDTTSAAFSEFSRTLETKVAQAFLDAVGGQEFLDKLKHAAVAFADELQSGAGIGEALEVALEIPGLADFIHRFESAVNNLIINILQASANIGEGLGLDVSGLRKEIGRIAGGQLSYDLQLATSPEELQRTINTAIERGVNPAAIQQSINTAVGELVAAGDLEGAQQLLSITDQLINSPISDFGQSFLDGTETAGEAADKLQQKLDELRSKWVIQPDAASAAGQEFAKLEQDIANLKLGDSINLNFASNTLTEAASALNTQLDEAINAHDWDTARVLGTKLNSIGWRDGIQKELDSLQREDVVQALFPEASPEAMNKRAQEYLAQFQTSLSSGSFNTENFKTASTFLNMIPTDDPELQQKARDLVQQYAFDLTTAFDEAVASGDLELAEDLYNIISIDLPEGADDPFITKLDELREATVTTNDEMTTSTTTMADSTTTDMQRVGTATDETRTKVNDLSSDVTTRIPQAQNAFTNFLTAIANGSLPAIGMLVSLATQFKSISDSVDDITGGAKGGETPPAHAAGTGATRPGTFLAGEQGPELITSNRSLAVLNNASTSSIMAGLRGMAGMGAMGGAVNNTSVRQNHTWNIMNDVQFDNAWQTVNDLRGYG